MFVLMCVIIIQFIETSKGTDEEGHLRGLPFSLNKGKKAKKGRLSKVLYSDFTTRQAILYFFVSCCLPLE